MKTILLIAVLMMVASPLFAQPEAVRIEVYAKVNNSNTHPFAIVNGSDTVRLDPSDYEVGQPLYGPGLPYGTMVKEIHEDWEYTSGIIMTNKATKTIADDTISGYMEVATKYTAGDWLGLPVKIWDGNYGVNYRLLSVVLTDGSDTIGNTDIVFYQSYSDTEGLDNMPVGKNSTDANECLGVVQLTGVYDWGQIRTIQKDNINMALPGDKPLYCRLIARSTPQFAARTSLMLKLYFVRN